MVLLFKDDKLNPSSERQITMTDQTTVSTEQPSNSGVRILKDVSAFKASIVIILTPLIASPLLCIGGDKQEEARCAYCVVVMGAYWMFEVMPLAVTALMPLFLFPVLGVMSASKTAPSYLPDINFLFVGGLIVAVAVEKCNLHQRIALRVLTIVGSEPKWIMLGFMCVTAFLSMWISNTATTAMMVPIAQSVVVQLIKSGKRKESMKDGAHGAKQDEIALSLVRHEADSEHTVDLKKQQPEEEEDEGTLDLDKLSKLEANIAKGLLISIAFSANIGGTGTITGTPPNLVTVGQLDKLYPGGNGSNHPVDYVTWMIFGFPPMLVGVMICWLILMLYFMRGAKGDPRVNEMMKDKYNKLPPMSFAEISVSFCFLVLLTMWITRSPGGSGFGNLFKKDAKGKGYFTDATSAMVIGVLLFMLPNEPPDFLCCRTRNRKQNPKLRGALMDWPTMQQKFPWSVVLLLGGGFALAAGVKSSGLSGMVGDMLKMLGSLPLFMIQFCCVLITMAITNICSNTVTASIFVPIVCGLANELSISPLALALPVCLACSYAFVLPVATPPNAIVFASGMLKVTDMMIAGLLVSVVSTVLIVGTMMTYAHMVYPVGSEFPMWAAVAKAKGG